MEIIRNHEDVTLVLQMPSEKVFDDILCVWTYLDPKNQLQKSKDVEGVWSCKIMNFWRDSKMSKPSEQAKPNALHAQCGAQR